MDGRLSRRRARYAVRMFRPRANAHGPHELTPFDWVCYPKDESFPHVWYPGDEKS